MKVLVAPGCLVEIPPDDRLFAVKDVVVEEQVGQSIGLFVNANPGSSLPGTIPVAQIQGRHLRPERRNVLRLGSTHLDQAPEIKLVVRTLVEVQKFVEDDEQRLVDAQIVQSIEGL